MTVRRDVALASFIKAARVHLDEAYPHDRPASGGPAEPEEAS